MMLLFAVAVLGCTTSITDAPAALPSIDAVIADATLLPPTQDMVISATTAPLETKFATRIPLATADAQETIIPEDSGLVQARTLGDLTVSFFIDPHVFEPTTIDILVADANGQPAHNVERVGVTLAMEGMNHGAMGIEAMRVAPGLYRAQGQLLVMTGRWHMGLRVKRTDGVVESGVFAFVAAREDGGEGKASAFYRRPAGTVQIEDIAVYPEGIEPRTIRVRAQTLVRLEVMYVDNPFCGPRVAIPELGHETAVSSEGLAELEFMPPESSTLAIECSETGMELRQRN